MWTLLHQLGWMNKVFEWDADIEPFGNLAQAIFVGMEKGHHFDLNGL